MECVAFWGEAPFSLSTTFPIRLCVQETACCHVVLLLLLLLPFFSSSPHYDDVSWGHKSSSWIIDHEDDEDLYLCHLTEERHKEVSHLRPLTVLVCLDPGWVQVLKVLTCAISCLLTQHTFPQKYLLYSISCKTNMILWVFLTIFSFRVSYLHEKIPVFSSQTAQNKQGLFSWRFTPNRSKNTTFWGVWK